MCGCVGGEVIVFKLFFSCVCMIVCVCVGLYVLRVIILGRLSVKMIAWQAHEGRNAIAFYIE